MSLAVLADHLAAKGRNGDSMLVHMAPEEVAGLHSLALAHGEQLTINPETGLPEAFSLKSVLKAVLPVVAGIALGPAGFGVVSSALGAGAIVGGATALATGSLKQGIMAGLGAYGGFGIGQGLSAAGATAAREAATGAAAQQAFESASPAIFDAGATGTVADVVAGASPAAQQAAATSGLGSLSRGFGALTTEAGREAFMQGVGGPSGLLKAGYAAAVPAMMADQAVQTTTPRPFGGFSYQPRIRPMAFDPSSGRLEQLPMFSAIGTPTVQQQAAAPAAPQPTVTPPSPYPNDYGMASGGIVALAEGGASSPYAREMAEGRKAIPYASGTAATAQDIEQLYRDVLGRAADPGGLAFYEASQFSPDQIRQELAKSPEARGQIFARAGAMPTGATMPLGTTMDEVMRNYGQSFGTTPPAQTTPAQLTGASKAAYDYLMGQGAYPVTQGSPRPAPAAPSDQEFFSGINTFRRTGVPGPSTVDTEMVPTTTPQIDTGPIMRFDNGAYTPVPRNLFDEENRADYYGLASGGITALAQGGVSDLGMFSDGGRLLRGPGDGVSDSIPAVIGGRQPARLADGEFVIPARIVSELGNGSTEAGARKLYAMMDRVQRARAKTVGKSRGKVAKNTRAEKYLPA